LHALFNFIQILAKMYDVERDTCLGTLWSVYKIFLRDLIKTSYKGQKDSGEMVDRNLFTERRLDCRVKQLLWRMGGNVSLKFRKDYARDFFAIC